MGRWIDGEAGETEGLYPPRGRDTAASPSTASRSPSPFASGERGGDVRLLRCKSAASLHNLNGHPAVFTAQPLRISVPSPPQEAAAA